MLCFRRLMRFESIFRAVNDYFLLVSSAANVTYGSSVSAMFGYFASYMPSNAEDNSGKYNLS